MARARGAAWVSFPVPGMTPPTAPLRALRRLVAALLTLSIVLTTLGWAHPACESVADVRDAAAMVGMGHDGMPGMPAVDATDGGDAGHPADHCSGHGRHSESEDASCAMVAHCSAATVSAAVAIRTPELSAPTQPALPSSSRPLERADQPDYPPPRG